MNAEEMSNIIWALQAENNHLTLDNERLRATMAAAVEVLDAEHYPEWSNNKAESAGKEPIGCDMCWPKDGSWPCTSRMIADDLRAALGGGPGMNDNELADRTQRTGEAWEKIADGRANDERLIVSGYQAHDTAQTLIAAAARLRELSADNERLRAAGNELARLLHGRHDAVYTVSDDGWVLRPCAKDSCAAWRAALGEDRG